MHICTSSKGCDYNGRGCCISCTKPHDRKYECACECMDYYDKPEKCPLSRFVLDQPVEEGD